MIKHGTDTNTISPLPVQMDFTKPLEVLFQCHQRIAASLEDLVKATIDLRKLDENQYPQIFVRLDSALTHLSTTGKKHTRDEEESLFPRIFRCKDDGVSEVHDVVTQLEIQHKNAASIERSLTKMLRNLETCETIDQTKVDLFSDLIESLYSLYRPHIQVENEFVFPTAAKILSNDQLLEVGKEMYQSRRTKIMR